MWPQLLIALAQLVLPRAADHLFNTLERKTPPALLPKHPKPQPQITFVLAILTVCQRHHASITSWYRTPHHNRLAGGHAASKHLTADALDLVPDMPGESASIVRAIQALGYYALKESDHVHAQRFAPGPPPPLT